MNEKYKNVREKKKKIGLVLAMLMIMLAAMPANIFAQTAEEPSNYDTSDGSESAPYFISSLNNLYWLSQNSDEWDKHYKQTGDIDASDTQNWNSGNGFSPIGNSTTNFTGSYDGGGYTIDNLFINRSSDTDNYIGFFGYTDEGAAIDNIGMTNVDISGNDSVGGLVFWQAWPGRATGQVFWQAWPGRATGRVFG